MVFSILDIFDLIGTIAFALSGSAVAIRKKMDIFGVNMLAATTACGGGLIRDLIIGNHPPNLFKNPFYVVIALICGNLMFVTAYQKHHVPEQTQGGFSDWMLFWFDTLGLASFTVNGVMIGMNAGFTENRFLLVFLGFITAVGGGAFRDIMANQMPDIFVKHIYAVAAIAGALLMVFTYDIYGDAKLAMIFGFCLVIILRYMAKVLQWNLPRVE